MMPGRTRKFLTESDKEAIKEAVRKGTEPAVVAQWYGTSEFVVRKIAGLLME